MPTRYSGQRSEDYWDPDDAMTPHRPLDGGASPIRHLPLQGFRVPAAPLTLSGAMSFGGVASPLLEARLSRVSACV
jgi:hypothetical protein